MKRLINAFKLLCGKLVIEVHVDEEGSYSYVPSGVILKLTGPQFKLAEEVYNPRLVR